MFQIKESYLLVNLIFFKIAIIWKIQSFLQNWRTMNNLNKQDRIAPNFHAVTNFPVDPFIITIILIITTTRIQILTDPTRSTTDFRRFILLTALSISLIPENFWCQSFI